MKIEDLTPTQIAELDALARDMIVSSVDAGPWTDHAMACDRFGVHWQEHVLDYLRRLVMRAESCGSAAEMREAHERIACALEAEAENQDANTEYGAAAGLLRGARMVRDMAPALPQSSGRAVLACIARSGTDVCDWTRNELNDLGRALDVAIGKEAAEPSECPKCHRPKNPPTDSYEWSANMHTECTGYGNLACDIAAAAYRRGRRDGIAHAKRTVRTEAVYVTCKPPVACLDWTETDLDERGTK